MGEYYENYTNALNETRRARDNVREKLEEALKEISLRERYESFLKSVIRGGETLRDEQDFEWFRAKMGED